MPGQHDDPVTIPKVIVAGVRANVTLERTHASHVRTVVMVIVVIANGKAAQPASGKDKRRWRQTSHKATGSSHARILRHSNRVQR